MKVLWVDLLSKLGGAQYSFLETCTELSTHGVDVMAAVPQGPLFDRLLENGIRVFPVSPVRAKRGWGLFSTAAKLLQAPSTIKEIVRVVKPDIIHANSLPAFLAAYPAAGRIPVVWHVRDLQLPATVARDASRKAARIIAVSTEVDEMLASILSSRVLGRIRLIRNGIDLTKFENCDRATARQRLGIPVESPVIGIVSHLVPWKRHDAFIAAAAEIHRQLPDAHFVSVGRDLFDEHADWVAKLAKMIERAGLGSCFHRVRDCDDVSQVLPAFDLLMHPALCEPFGRVICEAMAASVPVIAAASGGPASIIQSGVSGILVRGGAPHDLAQEALALLAAPARAAAFKAAGRDRVRQEFSVGNSCARLIKEYRVLLANLET